MVLDGILCVVRMRMGGLVAGLSLQLSNLVSQWVFCGKVGGGDPSARAGSGLGC